jgi:hypothetical protein
MASTRLVELLPVMMNASLLNDAVLEHLGVAMLCRLYILMTGHFDDRASSHR